MRNLFDVILEIDDTKKVSLDLLKHIDRLITNYKQELENNFPFSPGLYVRWENKVSDLCFYINELEKCIDSYDEIDSEKITKCINGFIVFQDQYQGLKSIKFE